MIPVHFHINERIKAKSFIKAGLIAQLDLGLGLKPKAHSQKTLFLGHRIDLRPHLLSLELRKKNLRGSVHEILEGRKYSKCPFRNDLKIAMTHVVH